MGANFLISLFGHFCIIGHNLRYKNDALVVDSSLEAYQHGGYDKIKKSQKNSNFRGLGPNFLIWAFWAKNALLAITWDIKMMH